MMQCAKKNLDRNICTSSSHVSFRETNCRLTCGLCTVKRRQELQAPLYALLEVKPQTPTDSSHWLHARWPWLLACKRRASHAHGAVVQACVTPCMANLNNRCCMVPKKIASLFPCCREARPAFPLPHNASPRFIAAAGSGPPIGPPIVLAEFRAFYR